MRRKASDMKMTEEGSRKWTLNPETPDRIIAVALEGQVQDWPLPHYLLEHLENLAAVQQPTDAQVDEARIPLKNWFRQERDELLGNE